VEAIEPGGDFNALKSKNQMKCQAEPVEVDLEKSEVRYYHKL